MAISPPLARARLLPNERPRAAPSTIVVVGHGRFAKPLALTNAVGDKPSSLRFSVSSLFKAALAVITAGLYPGCRRSSISHQRRE